MNPQRLNVFGYRRALSLCSNARSKRSLIPTQGRGWLAQYSTERDDTDKASKNERFDVADYQKQLMLIEQQNKKRLMEARASESNSTESNSSVVANVAVLGGGITGLATAHYLSKEFPSAKITLYESKDTLGGWMKSKVMDVGDGEVIFESGPRSLRPQAPNGTLSLRLAQDLGLSNDVLSTSKSAPAAQNRFLYYPDHLVKMPGPGQSLAPLLSRLLSEPVFDGFFPGLFGEYFKDQRSSNLDDESVGAFIARRTNVNIANNLASALFHGIYAGNIWELSAKSILALPWARELKHGGLMKTGMALFSTQKSWNFCDDIELQGKLADGSYTWDTVLQDKIKDCSVFTFRKGIGQLTDSLEKALKKNANVKINRSTAISSVKKDKNGQLKLTHTSACPTPTPNETTLYTHVISTTSSTTTASFLQPTAALATSSVTVCVVNLYFRTPHLLTTLPAYPSLSGFGYLIPRTVPFTQNPERALGVIFDSDISPDLWASVPASSLGTRLTVMLGGHWWDGWTSYPTDAEAIDMATSVLYRHLGISEEPVAARATLQRDCIPQYKVGHSAQMGRAHEDLLKGFGGRVRVAGSSYTGVGVNDCLRSAWDVVQGLKDGVSAPPGSKKRELSAKRTGLERFAWGRPMALIGKTAPGYIDVAELEKGAVEQGFFEVNK